MFRRARLASRGHARRTSTATPSAAAGAKRAARTGGRGAVGAAGARGARRTPEPSAPERRLAGPLGVVETRSAPTAMRVEYDKRLMLVSGRANPELAAKIASKLGVELSEVTTRTFSNGEVYCRYRESVRGADVFVVQPICGNPDTGVNANDALMELLEMTDAAVGGSAHRVIAVAPWYGYSRQDKKSAPREPISARLVARMLESAGIDR